MVPENEREAPLGQIVELAFYMGASFFGGQVGDALSVDGSHCDEITQETFSFLAASAISAMETAGGTMTLNGRAYADRDEPDGD